MKRITAVQVETAAMLSVEACAEIFHAAGKDVEWEYQRWLRDPKSGSQFDELYCPGCASKHAEEENAEVDGWDESFEVDGVRWCDDPDCGVLLHHSLSTYGIKDELSTDGPRSGEDAAILANLAGGIGDLRDEHHGRLAKAALATKYGKDAWDRNDLVPIRRISKAKLKAVDKANGTGCHAKEVGR